MVIHQQLLLKSDLKHIIMPTGHEPRRIIVCVLGANCCHDDTPYSLWVHSFSRRYLFAANGTGVAPVYILFNAIVSCALVWLPYESLIEFSMLQFALCSLFFIYAYLWYKVKRPDMYRPLTVPGGLPGAIFVSFPIVAIGLVNIYYGTDGQRWWGTVSPWGAIRSCIKSGCFLCVVPGVLQCRLCS